MESNCFAMATPRLKPRSRLDGSYGENRRKPGDLHKTMRLGPLSRLNRVDLPAPVWPKTVVILCLRRSKETSHFVQTTEGHAEVAPA